jgi:DNA processing protein
VNTADLAALVALSGLPDMGPNRLRAVLERGGPSAAWSALAAGHLRSDRRLIEVCRKQGADAVARWTEAAEGTDPATVLARHGDLGITVLEPDAPGWPPRLAEDPDPPLLLFALGEPHLLSRSPSVAVVGTRRASRYGLDVARELGRALASAGVVVLSGLAAGIDGAAHAGALEAAGASPVGIVGSGLDVVYPRGHRQLWSRVAGAGALASEWPLGVRPARWRFPARNRILAALADVVVVVESPATGGALLTVDEALGRDRTVMAVPGPIGIASSQGTNRLLADGMAPVCDPSDVLLALGLDAVPVAAPPGPAAPAGDQGALLDALGWRPATLDQLVLRTGLTLERAARLLAELEGEGWLAGDGGWWERRR